MGNNKSKPTGTLHVRTTQEPIKTASNVVIVADSTMLGLESGRASDQDSTIIAADANAIAIAADATTGTTATEGATDTSVSNPAPVPLPAQTAPGTSAANTSPAPSTATKEIVTTVADAKTKMEIATEIFTRLKKVKGITRKEIIDQFVVEAKLSKAGASTYYQLIKAKAKK